MQLGTMSNMLRGLPMQAATTQQYQAAPSPLTQAVGLAGTTALLGSMKKGGLAKGIKGYVGGGVIDGTQADLEDMPTEALQKEMSVTQSPTIRNQIKQILQARAGSQYAGGGIIAFAKGDLAEDFSPNKRSVSLSETPGWDQYGNIGQANKTPEIPSLENIGSMPRQIPDIPKLDYLPEPEKKTLLNRLGQVWSEGLNSSDAVNAAGKGIKGAARFLSPLASVPASVVGNVGEELSRRATNTLADPIMASNRQALQDNTMLGALGGDTSFASGILDAAQPPAQPLAQTSPTPAPAPAPAPAPTAQPPAQTPPPPAVPSGAITNASPKPKVDPHVLATKASEEKTIKDGNDPNIPGYIKPLTQAEVDAQTEKNRQKLQQILGPDDSEAQLAKLDKRLERESKTFDKNEKLTFAGMFARMATTPGSFITAAMTGVQQGLPQLISNNEKRDQAINAVEDAKAAIAKAKRAEALGLYSESHKETMEAAKYMMDSNKIVVESQDKRYVADVGLEGHKVAAAATIEGHKISAGATKENTNYLAANRLQENADAVAEKARTSKPYVDAQKDVVTFKNNTSQFAKDKVAAAQKVIDDAENRIKINQARVEKVVNNLTPDRFKTDNTSSKVIKLD